MHDMLMKQLAGGARSASRRVNANVSEGSVSTLSGGTRTSFHGNGGGDPDTMTDTFASEDYEIKDRRVTQQSLRNAKGHKTVASRHARR